MEMCVATEEGSDMTVKLTETSTSASSQPAAENISGSAGASARLRKTDVSEGKADAVMDLCGSDADNLKTMGTRAKDSASHEKIQKECPGQRNKTHNDRLKENESEIDDQVKPVLSKDIISQIDEQIMKTISRYKFPAPSRKVKAQPDVTSQRLPSSSTSVVKSLGQIQAIDNTAGKQRAALEDNKEKDANNANKQTSSERSVIKTGIDKKSLTTAGTIPEAGQCTGSCEPAGKSTRASSVEKAHSDEKEDKPDDDVVWICFICAKGFSDQTKLMEHQEVCEDMMPMEIPSMTPTPMPATSEGSQIVPKKVEVAVRQEKCLNKKSEQLLPPVPTMLRKVGSGIKTLPLGLPDRSKLPVRRNRKFKDIYIPPSRDEYFKSLDLGPTKVVQEIFNSPRKPDMDCQIIDLTLEESPLPLQSPATPRTRYLMSQVSRDETNSRKRHLSFSHAADQEVKEEPKKKRQKADESSSESETTDSSSEDEKATFSKPVVHKSLLFGIPLTSPLGQRLKKHWQNEYKVPVITDPEMYCSTVEGQEDPEETAKQDNKTAIMEKLRHRPPAQVTFKFTKKYLNKWFHSYKFNKADKHEFEKTIWTGLKRESRLLKKQMKPCKVVLNALTKKDIIRLSKRVKKRPALSQYHYAQPNSNYRTIHSKVSQNVQYRVGQERHSNLMYLNNSRQQIRHQDFRATATRQRSPNFANFQSMRLVQPQTLHAVQGPTPQLLVRTFGSPGNVMLEVLPMQAQLNQSLKNAIGAPHINPSQNRSQKRKQSFDKVRSDDNLVICLSSDEEEEAGSQTTTTVHQRLGPASFKRRQEQSRMLSRLPHSNTGFIKVPPRSLDNSKSVAKETVSSLVFGNSFRPNTASGPQNPSNARTAGGTLCSWNYTKYKMVNGTIVNETPSSPTISSEATDRGAPLTPKISNVVSVNATDWDNSTKQTQEGSNQAELENMDYEVICLDSDDED